MTRRPLDARAVLLVTLLCMIWGVQQVTMKGVSADVPPVLQLAFRFAGATLFFGLWVMLREGPRAFRDGTLGSGLALGLLFSLEFVLVGSALDYTSAAHAIVFLYAAPLFTALGLQRLPEERLDGLQWAGILIAFGGIAVAFLGAGALPPGDMIRGDLLALGAAAAWGMSNVVLRRTRVGGAATAKTVLYQVGVATLVLSAYALVTGQTHWSPTMQAIGALVFQTLCISILSYLMWFWMLRRYLTSPLMLLSLLTPLFGVAFGAMLLDEPVEARFLLGAALVLGGIVAVSARARRGGARCQGA